MNRASQTPDIFLEKQALGETPQNEEDALAVEALQESNEEILDAYSPRQMAANIEERLRHRKERRRMRVLFGAVSLAAGAAALLLAVLMWSDFAPSNGATSGSSSSDGVTSQGGPVYEDRIKAGDPGLFVFKAGDQGQVELESGAAAAAGDVLQLKFNAGSAKSLSIVSVDGRGTVTLHFPQQAGQSAKVEPGQKTVLPYGYELDDAPKYERFFLIWSNESATMDVAAVLKTLESKGAADGSLVLPGKLEYRDFLVQKNK